MPESVSEAALLSIVPPEALTLKSLLMATLEMLLSSFNVPPFSVTAPVPSEAASVTWMVPPEIVVPPE